MRQNDLAFANFICTFGADKVLLDLAEPIVLPAFFNDTLVRKYSSTEYYFYENRLVSLGDRDGVKELAIAGHFVKDTILKRQQIFERGALVEDYRELASAPSAFFILLLSDHRLLYFAETQHAPDMSAFSSTIQIFMRRIWRAKLADLHKEANGDLTYKKLQKEYPMPVINVVPMARPESIADSIATFSKIERIKFRLIKPNDENDASAVLESLRKRYEPLIPSRLDVEVADAQDGLDKAASVELVQEAAAGANTGIVVTGKDENENRAQADNAKFALSVPIDNPPEADDDLTQSLYAEFKNQVAGGTVHRAPLTVRIRNALAQIGALL